MRNVCVERVLASDYTSSGQRSWADTQGDIWRRRMLGQMRLDALLYRYIIVPDTHLLDGPFFLETGPRELLTDLGGDVTNHNPILIRSRKPRLIDVFPIWITRGHQFLTPFSFKIVSDPETRTALARRLGETTVERWYRELEVASHPAEALANLLSGLLHDVEGLPWDEVAASVENAARSWAKWADSEAVAVSTYRQSNFNLPSSLSEEPIAADLVSHPAKSAVDTIHEIVRSGHFDRNTTRAITDNLRSRYAHDPTVLAEAAAIDRWQSRARYRALARQHDAGLIIDDRYGALLAEDSHGVPVGFERALETMSDSSAVALPDELYPGLLEADGETFGRAFLASRGTLEKWWATGDLTELRRAFDVVLSHIPASSRRIHSPAFASSLFGVVGAAAAAAGKATDDLVLGVLGALTAAPLAVQLGLERAQHIQARRRLVEFSRSRVEAGLR